LGNNAPSPHLPSGSKEQSTLAAVVHGLSQEMGNFVLLFHEKNILFIFR
jgi:hypothetical protein